MLLQVILGGRHVECGALCGAEHKFPDAPCTAFSRCRWTTGDEESAEGEEFPLAQRPDTVRTRRRLELSLYCSSPRLMSPTVETVYICYIEHREIKLQRWYRFMLLAPSLPSIVTSLRPHGTAQTCSSLHLLEVDSQRV